jgi:hypothetical protein
MSKETPFEFEGNTRAREKGGNSVPEVSAEKHDGPRATGKRVGQDAKISKCLDNATDPTLADSEVTGTKKREIGPAEAVRRKNNHSRDGRSVLGSNYPADITVGGK